MSRERVAPAGWLTLFGFAALLTAWSFRKWADVQIDFGRELYTAWRLSEGESLHTDLAWFNGPVSAWWNGMWMSLAGTSFTTLFTVNLAIMALVLVAIVRLVTNAAGQVAGLGAGFLFLGIFAFGQYSGIANYNFVTPYSHELTHGFLLALVALLSMGRLARGSGDGWALAAGGALGLAFLTKPEIFVAASLATAARATTLSWRDARASRRALLFVGALFVPIVLAVLALMADMDTRSAIRAALGGWVHLDNSELRSSPFYLRMAGLDSPGRNGLSVLTWSAAAALFVCGARALASRLPADRESLSIRALAAVLGGGVGLALLTTSDLEDLGRVLPIASAALIALAGARWRTSRSHADADALALGILGAALLAKQGLRPTTHHYGFVLALPATLSAAALLLGRIPEGLNERGRGGGAFMVAMGSLLVCITVAHLYKAHDYYHGEQARTFEVGQGADRMITDGRGEFVALIAAELEESLPDGATVLVLPEGIMLNWLTRRTTPTRYLNFMPPELAIWPEQDVVEELERHPPDAVVLLHKDTSEYGVSYFGASLYGSYLRSWLERGFEPTQRYGEEPFTSTRYGAEIWRPRSR